ncbi:MAG: D-aminoacylase [Armatimonadetes bacterium]|nr:D-aminoacylase [Armatimonadota bacterium]
MFDLIIANGEVVDGTGAPRRRADVGITGDRIAAVGDLSPAKGARRLDAAGKIVCPGFIDIHTHSDTALLVAPEAESAIRQGCTTHVTGNCGLTSAPTRRERRAELQRTLATQDVGLDWESFGQFLDLYGRRGTAINVVPLVGHCALRAAVMGYDDRPPTPEELRAMQDLLARSLDEGAVGMSAGLMYAPSMFAATDELVALCRPVVERDGIYATHMRSYASGVVDAVAETCEIARRSGVRAQISHLQVSGRPYWGKMDEALALIEEANRSAEVHADKYPYNAGSAALSQRLPGWAHAGGAQALLRRLADPETRARIRRELETPPAEWTDHVPIDYRDLIISAVATEGNKPLEGRSVEQIAALRGRDPVDMVMDLVLEENNRVKMIAHAQSEEGTRRVLTHAIGMVGSDGSAMAPYGPLSKGVPHPRSYGTFPRILGRYVRDEGLLSLEAAIRKMTGLPAAKLRLKDRGTLAAGGYADVTVFDPATVMDLATYTDPHRYSVGVEHVIVNGALELEGGRHNGRLRGRVLRGGAG